MASSENGDPSTGTRMRSYMLSLSSRDIVPHARCARDGRIGSKGPADVREFPAVVAARRGRGWRDEHQLDSFRVAQGHQLGTLVREDLERSAKKDGRHLGLRVKILALAVDLDEPLLQWA